MLRMIERGVNWTLKARQYLFKLPYTAILKKLTSNLHFNDPFVSDILSVLYLRVSF
jgi:hypothetical protein